VITSSFQSGEEDAFTNPMTKEYRITSPKKKGEARSNLSIMRDFSFSLSGAAVAVSAGKALKSP